MVNDTRSFSSGGSTRRTACGTTTYRIVLAWLRPSDLAAARCDGCTDSIPALNTSET